MPDDERLVTGYGGRLLLAVSVGWMFIQAGRLVVSPSSQRYRRPTG
ncbi:hypothetical protein [Halosegnis marinus]